MTVVNPSKYEVSDISCTHNIQQRGKNGVTLTKVEGEVFSNQKGDFFPHAAKIGYERLILAFYKKMKGFCPLLPFALVTHMK